jgi:c-di-GMP-binding flagellar brake protein YcgR
VKERRKFKRYKVPEGKIFVFNHFSTKVGFIKNLSRGGCLFEYIHLVEEVIDPEVVDLFSYDFNKFFLIGLPCERVFISKESKEEDNGHKTKRCGLKFQDLDEKQKAQLDRLLDNYVAPIA